VSPGPLSPLRWDWQRWGLVGLLLLAWALRLPPALENRFHADEALYGYWGLLIGRGRDPWLAMVPVFKPPLLPYLVAGAELLFGNSEFAVRLPGLLAGLATIPLAAALSYALYRDRWAALGAAAGVALSPFAILFSATAFTDPLMVALGLGASLAAARGRLAWAGLLAGSAFAAKQTGLIWLPLIVGLQILNTKSQTPNRQISKSPTSNLQSPISNPQSRKAFLISHSSFLISFFSVAVLVFVWDRIRAAQGAASFWRLGVVGYGGLRLIWPQELWTRLAGWVGLARYFFASPVVSAALLVGLSLLVWRAIVRHPYARESLTDLLFISSSLVYFLLHWLWAFPVWDRYLLPLIPILSILLGRTLTLAASYPQSPISIRSLSFIIYHLSFVILLLLPAWNAAHSRYPVGGDHGAYDGIDRIVAFLRALPEGSVVYQHWLGWHYADYLFDGPVYVAYWPTPAWLARDVQAFGTREPRYIAFPSWESPARVEQALAGVGYTLAPVLTTTRRDGTRSFTLYHIQPQAAP